MIASGLPDAATTSGASGGVATKQDMFVRPVERRPVTQKEPKIGGEELRIQSTISQARFDALQKQIAVSDNESIAGQVSSDSDEVPMFLQSENNYCVTLEHALGTHDKLTIFDRLVFRTRQDDHSIGMLANRIRFALKQHAPNTWQLLQPIKTKTLEGIEVVEHSAYILTVFASADGRNGQVIKLTERNCYKKLREFLAFAPKEKTVGDVEYVTLCYTVERL